MTIRQSKSESYASSQSEENLQLRAELAAGTGGRDLVSHLRSALEQGCDYIVWSPEGIKSSINNPSDLPMIQNPSDRFMIQSPSDGLMILNPSDHFMTRNSPRR